MILLELLPPTFSLRFLHSLPLFFNLYDFPQTLQMETVWCFHYETWDEPWSSDDFPAGESREEINRRLRRLTSKAWWENRNSEVVEFLHDELPF